MNSLKNISNQELTLRLEKLVRTERKVTHLVLLHIAEIEARKVFAELGFESMYTYLTQGLGYSEGSAYRRLQSARLLQQIPEIAEKIEDGKLNLSQLTQLQKCVKAEIKNTGQAYSKERTLNILEKLENQNTFETQQTLACEMNFAIETREKIKPQQDESVRLEITLSKEQFEELQTARDLLSHVCPDGSWSEVIATLAKQFNQRKLLGQNLIKGKVKKHEHEHEHEQNKNKEKATVKEKSRVSGSFKTQNNIARGFKASKQSLLKTQPRKNRRLYISIKTKRQLLEKAKHCCEFVDAKTGLRCSSKFQLEVDHIQPLALGGSDTSNNLRILCRTHNLLSAKNMGLRQPPSGRHSLLR